MDEPRTQTRIHIDGFNFCFAAAALSSRSPYSRLMAVRTHGSALSRAASDGRRFSRAARAAAASSDGL